MVVKTRELSRDLIFEKCTDDRGYRKISKLWMFHNHNPEVERMYFHQKPSKTRCSLQCFWERSENNDQKSCPSCFQLFLFLSENQVSAFLGKHCSAASVKKESCSLRHQLIKHKWQMHDGGERVTDNLKKWTSIIRFILSVPPEKQMTWSSTCVGKVLCLGWQLLSILASCIR